jgi:hypothetical protein
MHAGTLVFPKNISVSNRLPASTIVERDKEIHVVGESESGSKSEITATGSGDFQVRPSAGREVGGRQACLQSIRNLCYATSMNRDWERNLQPSTHPSERPKRLSIACLRSKQVSAGHLTSRYRQGSVH